jgi:hypothetical protein
MSEPIAHFKFFFKLKYMHLQLAGEYFGSLPATAPENVVVSGGDKPYFIGSDVRMREDDMDQAYFAIGEYFKLATNWPNEKKLTCLFF